MLDVFDWPLHYCSLAPFGWLPLICCGFGLLLNWCLGDIHVYYSFYRWYDLAYHNGWHTGFNFLIYFVTTWSIVNRNIFSNKGCWLNSMREIRSYTSVILFLNNYKKKYLLYRWQRIHQELLTDAYDSFNSIRNCVTYSCCWKSDKLLAEP